MEIPEPFLQMLQCPEAGEPLSQRGDTLVCRSNRHRFPVSPAGVPVFAETFLSADARLQRDHYDRIAGAYLRNLAYPHTMEYTAYLDRVLLEAFGAREPGLLAEICCGRGEALHLIGDRATRAIGVDVSLKMLDAARRDFPGDTFGFIQADATILPLKDDLFDTVVMLGGIHHVRDRRGLFAEIFRVLKPGGVFLWREPVSDFLPWRALRSIIYRLSPTLDHETERPLLWKETVPPLEEAGLRLRTWRTCGFLGFCLLMNSDVLVFNRGFRFIPGIRWFARAMARFDDAVVRFPGLSRAGLQVVGVAEKSAS